MPVYAGEIQGPGLGMNIDVFNELIISSPMNSLIVLVVVSAASRLKLGLISMEVNESKFVL